MTNSTTTPSYAAPSNTTPSNTTPSYAAPSHATLWHAAPSPAGPTAGPGVPPDGLVGHQLVKTYATDPTAGPPALAGVDLAIAPGESIAVMGPSGSGKTTLLHVLAGVLPPTGGQVRWRGRDVTSLGDRERTALRRSEFGFVFQSGQLLPELPAVENVALPLLLAGLARRDATARAAALFAPLGLAGLERRRPGELSGGQAQRVAIARALVGGPGVVFADEPTGALDQATGHEVMGHLTGITRHTGASLVLVTHDPGVAAWCSRVVTMRDGRVVADGPAAGGAAPDGPAAGGAAADGPAAGGAR